MSVMFQHGGTGAAAAGFGLLPDAHHVAVAGTWRRMGAVLQFE